jgi:hypothetical protein
LRPWGGDSLIELKCSLKTGEGPTGVRCRAWATRTIDVVFGQPGELAHCAKGGETD